MSQAENVPTTSRRSFMRSAAVASAVLPATAGLAVAASAPEPEKLRALEAEISPAWEHLGSTCEILAAAEGRLHAWEKENPKPVVRECRPYSQDEAEAAIRHAQERDARDPSFRAPSFIFVQAANADYKAAWREHEEAMKAWNERHDLAKEETGYNRATELSELAGDRVNAAIEEMVNTRATTIEGIRCKARTSANIEEWANANPELSVSIVVDLVGETSFQKS